MHSRSIGVAVRILIFASIAAVAWNLTSAQTAAPASSSSSTTPGMAQVWGDVLHDSAVAEAPVSNPSITGITAGDFVKHFYFETKTEYARSEYNFSGQPTATGVIDAPQTGMINPAGFPYPPAFQPNTNTVYSLLNTGTQGLFSDRINTNLTLRYRQDLTHVDAGSPGQSILDTFNGNHLFEFLNGYVEINGKPTDGFFTDSSLRLGRQTLYGSSLVSLDGASFTRNRPNYTLTLFGGRRFTYYSDPTQRAIGGLDFQYRLNSNTQFEYHTVLYLKGMHEFNYHQKIRQDWLVNAAFRMVGIHPTDFSSSLFWAPSDGRTTVGATFFQKLTNNDFFYDYTLNATDQYNALPRLYLGPIAQYSQFSVEARRTFNSHLRLGGVVVVRRLNDPTNDEGPFDVSLQDYRFDTQVYPWRKIEIFGGFHQRDSNRKNPLPSDYFADVSGAGETRVQDFTLEVGRGFLENRVSVRGGGFIRRVNFQDTYTIITDTQDKGFAGNASLQLDSRTRVYFEYGLDTDFFVWRPYIKNGQVFRLGMNWKY